MTSHPNAPRTCTALTALWLSAVFALGCALVPASAWAFGSNARDDINPGSGKWLVLESSRDGFRALVPGLALESSKVNHTIVGRVEEKAYSVDGSQGAFSIGFHVLPKLGKLFAPSSLVLSKVRSKLLETTGGEEISFQKRRIGRHPGGVLVYETTNARGERKIEEVRLVLAGQRLYILTAGHRPGSVDRSAMDRFFASFEVLD